MSDVSALIDEGDSIKIPGLNFTPREALQLLDELSALREQLEERAKPTLSQRLHALADALDGVNTGGRLLSLNVMEGWTADVYINEIPEDVEDGDVGRREVARDIAARVAGLETEERSVTIRPASLLNETAEVLS